MRLVFRITMLLACVSVLLSCGGTPGSILPQATIPLPQHDDPTVGPAYIVVSSPDENGVVDVTSSKDLLTNDKVVVIQVVSLNMAEDELGIDVEELDDDLIECKSDLPSCPSLSDDSKCYNDPAKDGSIHVQVPADVDDFVVVNSEDLLTCERTNLAEIKVATKEVSVTKEAESEEFKDVSEDNENSNTTYEESDEYVIETVAEAAVETTGSGMPTQVGDDSADETGEVVSIAKEEAKEKITLVDSKTTVDSTDGMGEVEQAEKIIPVLPKTGFLNFVRKTLPDGFFSGAKGISKTTIMQVPLLEIIRDELVMVVGVQVRGQLLLHYYIIVADYNYVDGSDIPTYTLTDYNFVAKSNNYVMVIHAIFDDSLLGGHYITVLSRFARELYIVSLDSLEVVMTKSW